MRLLKLSSKITFFYDKLKNCNIDNCNEDSMMEVELANNEGAIPHVIREWLHIVDE